MKAISAPNAQYGEDEEHFGPWGAQGMDCLSDSRGRMISRRDEPFAGLNRGINSTARVGMSLRETGTRRRERKPGKRRGETGRRESG